MAEPVIDPKFFSNEADLDVLLEGVRLSIRILEDPAFAGYRGQEFAPGKSVRTDDELRSFIRAACHTAYHPVGTCRMGNDSQAVVDAELRVRGMEALRVVDASIMPTIIGGNTNAPTIMIAEKAADMILGKVAAEPASRSADGSRPRAERVSVAVASKLIENSQG
jgi:choline dehydrogenase